jgi:hypothetical protein
MFSVIRAACLALLAAITLAGCLTSETADLAHAVPPRQVNRIVSYVSGPAPLASNVQVSISREARRRGLAADNALALFPPTRSYTDADILQVLAARGADGVLIINVGEAGVPRQYAGTMFQGRSAASSAAAAAVASVNGNPRPTTFTARLIEPATARHLWDGSGHVDTGGVLYADDDSGAEEAVAAIFEELQQKGIVALPPG